MSKIAVLTMLLFLSATSKPQYVVLPDVSFSDFLQSKYPSCFHYDQNQGIYLLDTTCSAIASEDSLLVNFSSYTNIFDLTGIQYFTSLRYLSFSPLTAVYDSPPLPASLRYLDISNGYSFIPILPSGLRYLNCSTKYISTLDAFPDSLRYLNCSGNSVSSLPPLPPFLDTLICSSQYGTSPYNATLSALPALPQSLKYLDCSSNGLISLPALPNGLKYLNCSQNTHNTNPENFYLTLASLPPLPDSLQTLLCSLNKLTGLPTLPAGLKILDCSNTKFSSYYNDYSYPGINSLPSLPEGLVTLKCNQDNLDCIPHLPPSLTSINVSGNNINCLPNSGNYTQTDTQLPLCSITNNANQCITNSRITGRIFYDNNNNGSKDAGENYRPAVKVKLSNGFTAYSNDSGYFEISADTGLIHLAVTAPAYYAFSSIDTSYNIHSYDSTIYKLLGLHPTASVDSLNMSIIPLSFARPGFNLTYRVNYENVGTTAISPIIGIDFNNQQLVYNSSDAAVVSSGNHLSLAAATLLPGDRRTFYLNTTVAANAALGDTLLIYATATANSATGYASNFSVIRGSYDPNDKQATPNLSLQQVTAGNAIDYLVRFQNTGTDTAFNIVVTDTLSGLLQAETFELTGASHSCKITRNGNKIAFEFINILLPDSSTNEPMSHGYISFKIKPAASVAENDVISNKAFIYFDYNLPVITNNASTLIKSSPLVFTFTGNGNWNNPANWSNGIFPPAPVPANTTVLIDPAANGQCIINVVVRALPGATIIVKDGKKLAIPGNLNIK